MSKAGRKQVMIVGAWLAYTAIFFALGADSIEEFFLAILGAGTMLLVAGFWIGVAAFGVILLISFFRSSTPEIDADESDGI